MDEDKIQSEICSVFHTAMRKGPAFPLTISQLAGGTMVQVSDDPTDGLDLR